MASAPDTRPSPAALAGVEDPPEVLPVLPNEGAPFPAPTTEPDWVLPPDDGPGGSLPTGSDDSPVLALPTEPPPPPRAWPVRLWNGFWSGVGWLFGLVSLVVGLAALAAIPIFGFRSLGYLALAAIPIFGFLSLGYLLESAARVARSGRLRDGFIGVRKAARVGGIFLGVWLILLPLRYLSSVLASSEVINTDVASSRPLRTTLLVLTVLAGLHIALACLRGGRLRYFLWPFGNLVWLVRQLRHGRWYATARDAVWDFVVALRLPYYFWLGLRGFAGAALWLFPPITLIAAGRVNPALGLLGGLLLAVVLLYLPFLQTRFAVENRFRAFLEIRAVRRHFARAPWAFALALFLTLLLSLPLYLLKIEMVPADAVWLLGLFFIAFIWPTRLLTGWAFGRSLRRTTPRHWAFRWTARLTLLPTTLTYVFFVFFTQYIVWHGVWGLYEQHAFLLPAPFVGR